MTSPDREVLFCGDTLCKKTMEVEEDVKDVPGNKWFFTLIFLYFIHTVCKKNFYQNGRIKI